MELILKSHLDKYYDSLVEYKHVASRINTIFLKDIEKYNSPDSILKFASSLVLRDWSGSTDKGWSYAYPTDSKIYTDKENYTSFIDDLISKQLCLMYVQSFEGLERFMKDIFFEFVAFDDELKDLIAKVKKGGSSSRKNMPSGKLLLQVVEEAIDLFLYQKGKIQFDLKTSLFILSETRHQIIHNNYILSKSKIFCSTDKRNLFVELFKFDMIDNDRIKIQLDMERFNRLIDFMCEFAFQILKKSCLKYDLNWKLYKNMDK